MPVSVIICRILKSVAEIMPSDLTVVELKCESDTFIVDMMRMEVVRLNIHCMDGKADKNCWILPVVSQWHKVAVFES